MVYVVGIDIGGTKINLVLLKNLRVVRKIKIFTPRTKKRVIEALKENIHKIISGISKSKVSGIGIGVTGPVNQKRDVMLNPPNQKYLRGCPLAKIIEKDLKIKTLMDNDVNCFVLAEAIMGAGKGKKIVAGVTLGTGLGEGMVINGQLYRGFFGSAGQGGHMTIDFNGPRCGCGNLGCWEAYGSEKFFKRKNFLPQKLAEKAKKGSKKALKIYQEYGKYLGIGLSSLINILDPEVIVIGGGIANAYQLFIKEAEKEIKRRVTSPIAKRNLKIKKTKLGDTAGAIGAALLFYYAPQRKK